MPQKTHGGTGSGSTGTSGSPLPRGWRSDNVFGRWTSRPSWLGRKVTHGPESNSQQLRDIVRRLRDSPCGPKEADSAYEHYQKYLNTTTTLCHSIFHEESHQGSHDSQSTGLDTPSAQGSTLRSPDFLHERSSFSDQSLVGVARTSSEREQSINTGLIAMQEWCCYLDDLEGWLRVNLVDILKKFEPEMSPDMVNSMAKDLTYRTDLLNRMRNVSINRVMSADVPVLRFRVSPHMLAKTSPLFARMFSGSEPSMYVLDDDDVSTHLPPRATKYICKDGSEAKLYRMPQFEMNRFHSLETLLHAAHLHTEEVPREVPLDRFVAIAECCIRYKCTSPLELFVEHAWLPDVMRRGLEEISDRILPISYAFGLRDLFTDVSKMAILNLADEADLQDKPWPQRVKDKIWAVRCGKLEQAYASCGSMIQEYISQPLRNQNDPIRSATAHPSDLEGYNTAEPSPQQGSLSTIPRCSRGSHSCDALNLGWMMLALNELDILPAIMRPRYLTPYRQFKDEPRSLARLKEAVSQLPDPLSPVHHEGVCNPMLRLKAVVADVYVSVSGLTLHDISGRSHGWALSRNLRNVPQIQILDQNTSVNLTPWRMADQGRSCHIHTGAAELPESVYLRILAHITELCDLHRLARTNRGFYNTYRKYELYLMRNLLRTGAGGSPKYPVLPKTVNETEEKMPKQISKMLQMEFKDPDSAEKGTTDGENSGNRTPAPGSSRFTEDSYFSMRVPSVVTTAPSSPPSPTSKISIPNNNPMNTSPWQAKIQAPISNDGYFDDSSIPEDEIERILSLHQDSFAPGTRSAEQGAMEKVLYGDKPWMEDKSLVEDERD